jgi:hypothetical protein
MIRRASALAVTDRALGFLDGTDTGFAHPNLQGCEPLRRQDADRIKNSLRLLQGCALPTGRAFAPDAALHRRPDADKIEKGASGFPPEGLERSYVSR